MLATQIVLVAVAFVWASAGLLKLPAFATVTLAVMVSIPVLWVCCKVVILAWQSETNPENN